MGDDIPLGFLIGLLFLLLICSAFFSGTETALMTLNRYRLRHKAKTGHRGAMLAENLLQQPDRLIGLILLCNNLVNVFAVQLVTLIALRLGSPFWLAASGLIFTVVLLIFAEVTPKTLATLKPETLALPASYIYTALTRVLAPFVWLINQLANGLLRLIGITMADSETDHLTVEELRTLVAEAGELIPRRRHQMLVRILELQDISVDDVMVPQTEIAGIDLNEPWNDILNAIKTSPYTRLPVFKDSIDDLIGILHMKNLVRAGLENLDKTNLMQLVEDPYFVPEGTTLNKQIMHFQRMHKRTAFIVDEYGDIQGLVTLEDILEEIVGEFTSEPTPVHADVRKDEKDGYVVKGSANIRALNRMMNWHLPTSGPKTLNGLILETLEAIPEQGTGLMLNDYPIEILETSDSIVESVRIQSPLPPPV